MTIPVLPLGNAEAGRTRTWMHFYGDPGTSLGILLKGALLAIPTLGFYRFWLITRLRRYLWQNTRIGDDAFEYLGTAKELLLGFLAAVAILVPLYLVYFLIGLESERWKAFASVPLVLVFVLLGKFAEFRARRYRLTRTAFRGIRFLMTGSGLRYAAMWAGWSLLTVLTLGLARPWQVASLERYKVGHTSWGTLACRFEGTGRQLLRQGIAVWAIGVSAALGAAAIIGLQLYLAATGGQDPGVLRGVSVWHGLIVILYPVAGLSWLYYVGIEWRWWINGLRMGDLALSTDLPRSVWLTRNLAFIGVCLLVLLVVGIVAFAVAMLFAKSLAGMPVVSGILIGVTYVGVILGLGVAYRQMLVCGFWRNVANAVRVENLQVLDTATAAGGPSGILGEGLAEALDVGAF